VILPWNNISDWAALGSDVSDIDYIELPVEWNDSEIFEDFLPAVKEEVETLNWDAFNDISTQFNGIRKTFKLTRGGQPVNIQDPSQLLVLIGGVPQPQRAWTLTGDQISFVAAPSRKDQAHIIQVALEPTPFTISESGLIIEFNRAVPTGNVLISIAGEFVSPVVYSVSGSSATLPNPVPEFLRNQVTAHILDTDQFFLAGIGDGETTKFPIPHVANNLIILIDEVLQTSWIYDGEFLVFPSPPNSATVIWGASIIQARKSVITPVSGGVVEDIDFIDHVGQNWWGIHPSAGTPDASHFQLDVLGLSGYTEEDIKFSTITREFEEPITRILYVGESFDQPFSSDVAEISWVGHILTISPKRNWLVSGVDQIRSMLVYFESGSNSLVTLNPTDDQLYQLDATQTLSEQTLPRVWGLPPLRVESTGNSLVADFGVVANDEMDSAIRLPPSVSRDSLEWNRAKFVAEEGQRPYLPMTSVGYAYLAADLSAADEAIFDPQSIVCQRAVNPRLFSGYYRQRF
jgi:hypothetical protein